MSQPTRVALALGSGGARGYAHIGVLEVLRERGHQVVGLAGSSMGALVGGALAADRLTEFTAWARDLSQRDVLRLIDPRWASGGAIAADRLLEELEGVIGRVQIEDLSIPFTAVATDLVAQREVWFQRGDLLAAVRASIAIPGVFTPVTVNGRMLVDGGLLNPVPINATASAQADVTVAVSLQGDRFSGASTPTKESASPAKTHPRVHISDVVSLSTDAMQSIIARYRMAGQPPDVSVTVPVSAARSLDLHRADELIALGRTLAEEAFYTAGL